MTDLKAGWQRVKFGEVVRLNKETCKDPGAGGINRVIGLEHLEPGDLRVRSWADVADGTTFSNRVRPGQVLFGKRRAYQRKVAVADFDAICSGDIYVFESADPNRLLPELLPFICQTEAFFEYAVGTSAGSLSPRTNWKSLAEYEFALPPLEEQRRMSKALLAGRTLVESLEAALAALGEALRSCLLASYCSTTPTKPLQHLCRSDISYGIVQAGPSVKGGVPYVRVSEMTNREHLDPSEMMTTTPEIASRYSRTNLEPGDIVVALRGVPGLAQVVPESMRNANLSRGVARVAPSEEINSRYLLWALRSPLVQASVRQYANGWKGEDLREITIAQLRQLPIPEISLAKQEQTSQYIDTLDQSLSACRRRTLESRATQMMLCNRVLAHDANS
jgi:type I restriction enzyme S subunit